MAAASNAAMVVAEAEAEAASGQKPTAAEPLGMRTRAPAAQKVKAPPPPKPFKKMQSVEEYEAYLARAGVGNGKF